MFYLRLGDHTLVGASPEVMVRVEGREITLRPIAGTRRRGVTEAEDRALEAELLADPKERAEHVMLVDLGRNDVGRVSEIGSVESHRADGGRALLARDAHRVERASASCARDATRSTPFARPFRRAPCRARRKSARWR